MELYLKYQIFRMVDMFEGKQVLDRLGYESYDTFEEAANDLAEYAKREEYSKYRGDYFTIIPVIYYH